MELDPDPPGESEACSRPTTLGYDAEVRRLLTIQYLGTHYAGWQSQQNALTVQDTLERALAQLCGQPVRVHGAGRTDAGVHALAQRAHIDPPVEIPLRGFLLGLNGLLPPDIRVVAAEDVESDFHARFSAQGKAYRYQIWNELIADVFHSPTHTHVREPLDPESMRQALPSLIGHHDFRSFTVAEPEVSSTWRTLTRATLEHDGGAIRIELEGDGFLRFMVRRIAGSLIEIGRGALPPSAIADALEPAYGPARWTAPPEGLVLVRVDY